MLYGFERDRDEALFIAVEIKRLIAQTGGMLNHNDFAILCASFAPLAQSFLNVANVILTVRYNSLSRILEHELQKEGIPNRILGGHKFFQRIEVHQVILFMHHF